MNLPLWDITKNYHRNNPQSVKANEIAHKFGIRDRQRIIETLQDHPSGLTCEELEDITGLKHQTCSARCTNLKQEGKIFSVAKRKTRSGSDAAVYQAT